MRKLIAAIVSTVIVSSLSVSVFPTLALAAQDGHKHSDAEKQKLGRQQIAGYTVSVIITGDFHVDKEIGFDVKLIEAKSDPKAIRVWIGTEDAKGSEKAALNKKTTTFGGVAKVPSPLPEPTKVWVEIETEAGVAKGSYVVEEKHDHKH